MTYTFFSASYLHFKLIVITPIRITTAFANPEDVEKLVNPVDTDSESKRANTEFLVWCTLERFQMIGWVAPFVGRNLV
jgi:hypothetical protein